MGILSVVNRNLISNSESQLLKYLSSNLRLVGRISSPAGSSKKAQSPPTSDDFKSNNNNNNNKLMLLIQHFHSNENSRSSQFPPYDYSTISADNSWTDHYNRCKPFSRYCCNYVVAGSCNALMLIFFYNLDSPFTYYGKYLIWNPTTDKFTILPPPGPSVTNNMHGFGFDSKSQDYKVIRFPQYMSKYKSDDDDDDDDDRHFEMYSLKTNAWKKITYPSCGRPFPRPCVL